MSGMRGREVEVIGGMAAAGAVVALTVASTVCLGVVALPVARAQPDESYDPADTRPAPTDIVDVEDPGVGRPLVPAREDGAQTDRIEARIREDVRAAGDDVARAFERANAREEAGDFEGAIALYTEAHELAPDLDHPIRRRCSAEVALGRAEQARADCEAAMAMRETELNLAAMITFYARTGDLAHAEPLLERARLVAPNDASILFAAFEVARAERDPTRMDAIISEVAPLVTDEERVKLHAAAALVALDLPETIDHRRFARRHAEAAVALAPDDVDVRLVLLQAEILSDDFSRARATAEGLVRDVPDDFRPHYFLAIVAGNEGELDEARESLDRARSLGLPEPAYRDLDAAIDDVEPVTSKAFSVAWIIVKALALWGAILLLLLGVGSLLSRIALGASRRIAQSAAGAAPLAAWLRRAYHLVLWLSCGFYYLSLPLLLVVVIGLAVGIIGGVLAAGYVSIKLFAIVGLVAIVTIGAVVKSIFVRVKEEDPGPELDLSAHPKLRAVIDEVAAKVGTEGAHRVFLTPGADIAVFERGGVGRQLGGRAERCLILGAGVLDGLDQRAFKAILAHEHGHFVNRDTAGGGFALAVRQSLVKMAMGLAQGGAAAWYNPAWMFLNAFYRVFMRISHGASRLQEVLADRWAALAYGARAFERGLRHVVARGVRFDVHANMTIDEVVEQKAPLTNLYTYVPSKETPEDDLAKAIEEELGRTASAYDSHPAPKERFEFVHALGADDPASDDESLPAWDLFEDRDAIETMMTDEIRANLARAGLVIEGEARL